MGNLAGELRHEGRYAEAEKLQRETLDMQHRVFGPKHPDTVISIYNLRCISAYTGNRDQAFALLREAVDDGLPPAPISPLNRILISNLCMATRASPLW